MFANELDKALEKRFPKYGASNDLFAFANFLDPRYMGVQLENAGIYEEVKKKVVEQVEVMLIEVEGDISMESSNSSNDSSACGPSLSELVKKKSTSKSSQDLTSHGQMEVNSFLIMPSLPCSSTSSQVLDWWKGNSGSLPGLSKLARKYLGIPASSAPSERLFSVSGGVVTPTRTCINTENVSAIVYIHNNLKICH